MNVNIVVIGGNVTADPELRQAAGKSVTQFNVAVNRKWKDQGGNLQEEVSFIKVTAWGKTAELCCQYLAKGSAVLVQGRLKQETWEKDGAKKEKTGVVADNVQFIGEPKKRAEGAGAGAGAQAADEDVPF